MLGGETCRVRDVPPEALLPVFMDGMAFADLGKTVSHQEFVVSSGEQRSGNIDEDRNPRVIHVAEGFAAKENGCNDSGAQVTSEIGRDRDVGETPNHGTVCKTYGEGSRLRAHEGICRVQAGPDDDANIAVDEELNKEEIAKIAGPC